MIEPTAGTGFTAAALTGVTLYGVFTDANYGVVFGAFAGSVFYIASAAQLSYFKRIAYFIVSFIAGVLCAGLVGAKLAYLTGYNDKPLDALGAVIVSAMAIKILTFLSSQDFSVFVNLIFRRSGGNDKK